MKNPKQFRDCVIFVLKRSSCHFLRSLNQSEVSKTETNRGSSNIFFRDPGFGLFESPRDSGFHSSGAVRFGILVKNRIRDFSILRERLSVKCLSFIPLPSSVCLERLQRIFLKRVFGIRIKR